MVYSARGAILESARHRFQELPLFSGTAPSKYWFLSVSIMLAMPGSRAIAVPVHRLDR